MKKALLFLLVASVLVASLGVDEARAGESKPIQLSLVPSIQIYDRGTDIGGVRLMIAGQNANVTGLDLGFVGITTGAFKGLSWGWVGIVGDESVGWMNNWLYNENKGVFRGLQTGAVNRGVDTRGVQFGLVNYNQSVRGLQISFFNYTEQLDGLQIGIINVAKNAKGHSILPIVNWVF